VHPARDPAVGEIGNGAGQGDRTQYFEASITGQKRGEPYAGKYESRCAQEIRGLRVKELAARSRGGRTREIAPP
jgi:hypothetical protein